MAQQRAVAWLIDRLRRRMWLLALASLLLTAVFLEAGARLATLLFFGRSTQGQLQLSYYPYLENMLSVPPLRKTAGWERDLHFERRLAAAQRPKEGRLRVVIVGGSTAHAIPDRLFAAKLEELYGRDIDVVNLAFPGYIANQQVVMLGLFGINLQPDIVISIDGANDPAAVSKTGRPGLAPESAYLAKAARSPVLNGLGALARRSQLVTMALKWLDRGAEARNLSRPGLLEATAQQYLQAERALALMARGAGARYVQVLQPYLHRRKRPTAEELDNGVVRRNAYRSRVMADYLGGLAGRIGALPLGGDTTFIDGSTAFDQTTETCFTDEVHLTDRGNELLVEAIAARLRIAEPPPAPADAAQEWPLALPPGEPTKQVDYLD